MGYPLSRGSLTWPEVLALAHLEQAFPGSQPQNRALPVPGKLGHYYPAGTKERLQEKRRTRRPFLTARNLP